MAATLSAHTSHTKGAIKTSNQLGGYGLVCNTLLGLKGHLNGPDDPQGPWNSPEFVTMSPCDGHRATQIGLHEQGTDEIYYVLSGSGLLVTNGTQEQVETGAIVVAPKGTRHTLLNPSEEPLSFLVVELNAPEREHPCHPALIKNLPAQLDEARWVHPGTPSLQMAIVDLAASFGAASPWGSLSLLCIPPGGQIYEYVLENADELLFVVNTRDECATITAGGQAFRSDSHTNSLGMFATEPGEGLSVIVPAGMPRRIRNDCLDGPKHSGVPLVLLSLEVNRKHAPLASEQQAYQEVVV